MKTKHDKAQSEKFIEAARALGCDDEPAHFDELLKKVARHKPADDPPKVPKVGETETPNSFGDNRTDD